MDNTTTYFYFVHGFHFEIQRCFCWFINSNLQVAQTGGLYWNQYLDFSLSESTEMSSAGSFLFQIIPRMVNFALSLQDFSGVCDISITILIKVY